MAPRSRRVWAPCAAVALASGLLAPGAASQTSRADPEDVQARVGTELTLDLPNRWKASLQYQFRLVSDVSRYQGSYASAEVTRGVAGSLKLLGNYRLALAQRGTYHRFGLGAEADADLGDARLSLRPQIQFQRQHFEGDDDFGGDDDAYLRVRARVKHPLADDVAVYGSVEPYFKFGAEYPVDNWRNTVGFEFEFSDHAKLDAYYVYRPDYSKSYNRTFHIVGVELEWDVKVPRRHEATPGRH